MKTTDEGLPVGNVMTPPGGPAFGSEAPSGRVFRQPRV